MRIAFIHDWLVTWRGGEKCLEEILTEFQDADIYTIFADSVLIQKKLANRKVYKSFLSNLPYVKYYYRYLLPLYPIAIWHLSKMLKKSHEVTAYDKVVSISHCAVKNVSVPSGLPHICYCLTPVRYIWDQYDVYFKSKWYEPITRLVRIPFQNWDKKGSQNVTSFIAISKFVASRIKRYYERDCSVIYPPVDTERFMKLENAASHNQGYFLMLNALVPYKNIEVVLSACKKLGVPLKIIGDGPQRNYLNSLATPDIEILGWVDDDELDVLLSNCKALIYAAVEDFGIAPVEAQAAGKPVIVLNQGGCAETAIFKSNKEESSGVTAVPFDQPDANSVIEAIITFDELHKKGYFKPQNCRESAKRFSTENFKERFKKEIIQC